MRITMVFVALGLAVLLFFAALRHYLGFHYFYEYERVRSKAKSIEGSFSDLELNLKKALRFSKNPEFYKELAHLYLEMALAQNEFGTDEGRDAYCDLAREGLAQAIRLNPADASTHYEMGKVYLLYNFPLLTYFDKGKFYFLNALELDPASKLYNLNILSILLTQWNSLTDKEKRYVLERVKIMQISHEDFIRVLKNRWQQNLGNTAALEEILGSLAKT